MRCNLEAFDAEYAVLDTTLETAASWKTKPERVTVFTDAQTAIR